MTNSFGKEKIMSYSANYGVLAFYSILWLIPLIVGIYFIVKGLKFFNRYPIDGVCQDSCR